VLRIEDTEIKTWEKHVESKAECTIKGGVFSCLRTDVVSFHSDIYKYEDLKIVVNRESRFGEHYYNLALYDDKSDKGWSLTTVQAKMEISVRRLGQSHFVLWTDYKDDIDIKQCSFFTLHDNERTDNITVDYNRLKSIRFLPGDRVLIAFSQRVGGTGGIELRNINTLALYESGGKLVKTFYEFADNDEEIFSFIFYEDSNSLTVLEGNKKGRSTAPKKTVFNLDSTADLEGSNKPGIKLSKHDKAKVDDPSEVESMVYEAETLDEEPHDEFSDAEEDERMGKKRRGKLKKSKE